MNRKLIKFLIWSLARHIKTVCLLFTSQAASASDLKCRQIFFGLIDDVKVNFLLYIDLKNGKIRIILRYLFVFIFSDSPHRIVLTNGKVRHKMSSVLFLERFLF